VFRCMAPIGSAPNSLLDLIVFDGRSATRGRADQTGNACAEVNGHSQEAALSRFDRTPIAKA